MIWIPFFSYGFRSYARTRPGLVLPRPAFIVVPVGLIILGPQLAWIRRWLDCDGAVKHPEMMGFVVLGMFGGLRSAEIQRLDWSAVNVKERSVVVAGSQAKTRRRRVVDLTENAVAWLRAATVKREGTICGRFWDARWRIFRRSLGWAVGTGEKGLKEQEVKPVRGAWPHNALRHTYASMHYARTRTRRSCRRSGA